MLRTIIIELEVFVFASSEQLSYCIASVVVAMVTRARGSKLITLVYSRYFVASSSLECFDLRFVDESIS